MPLVWRQEAVHCSQEIGDDMRRWDKGYLTADEELGLAVIALLLVFAVCIVGAVVSSDSNQKEPISYAMKNSVTYMVDAKCPNCMKTHEIETSVGVEVKTEHACPWCGIKKGFTIQDGEQ